MFIYELKEKLILKDKDNQEISDNKIIIKFKGFSGLKLLKEVEKIISDGIIKLANLNEAEKKKSAPDPLLLSAPEMENQLLDGIEKVYGKEIKEKFIKEYEINKIPNDPLLDKYAKEIAIKRGIKGINTYRDLMLVDQINPSAKKAVDKDEHILMYRGLKMYNAESFQTLFELLTDNLPSIARFGGVNLDSYLVEQMDAELIEEFLDALIKKFTMAKLDSGSKFSQ